jgi:hypothetical protein
MVAPAGSRTRFQATSGRGRGPFGTAGTLGGGLRGGGRGALGDFFLAAEELLEALLCSSAGSSSSSSSSSSTGSSARRKNKANQRHATDDRKM